MFWVNAAGLVIGFYMFGWGFALPAALLMFRVRRANGETSIVFGIGDIE